MNEDAIVLARQAASAGDVGPPVVVETEAFRMLLSAAEAYFALYAVGKVPACDDWAKNESEG